MLTRLPHMLPTTGSERTSIGPKRGRAEAAGALNDALTAIGVRNARRVADAVSRLGSDAYITPSGPVLELLSALAEEGELETFAKAYGLFATVRPMNADFVREAVPAKIPRRAISQDIGVSMHPRSCRGPPAIRIGPIG